jgi:hypothetical protein
MIRKAGQRFQRVQAVGDQILRWGTAWVAHWVQSRLKKGPVLCWADLGLLLDYQKPER